MTRLNWDISVKIKAGTDLKKVLKDAEQSLIEHIYRSNAFNQVKTAEDLGISREKLRRRLEGYYKTPYKSQQIKEELSKADMF